MKFRDWIWLYLAAGSGFTRWAVLAYYGGGVVVLAAAMLLVLAAGPKAILLFLQRIAAELSGGSPQ